MNAQPRAAAYESGSAAATVATKLWTTFVRRMLLMERDFSRPPAAPTGSRAVRFEMLPRERVDALAQLRPAQPLDEPRERFARGDRCCAGWIGDRLVHAMWIARGTGPLPYLGGALVLEPGDAYVYDSFTPVAFRGHGLSPACHFFVAERMRAEGLRRALAAVAVENRTGRRVLEKAGYESVGAYLCVQIGGLRWIDARPVGHGRVPALVRSGRARRA